MDGQEIAPLDGHTHQDLESRLMAGPTILMTDPVFIHVAAGDLDDRNGLIHYELRGIARVPCTGKGLPGDVVLSG